MALIQFSVLKDEGGRPVGKTFSYVGGKFEKHSQSFVKGRVRRGDATSLADFARQLAVLHPCEVLSFGVCEELNASVLTQAQLARLDYPPGTISRTRKFFDWPAGPGILCFDYDPPDSEAAPLNPAELVQVLREAIPKLAGVTFAHKGSSSSCIYDAQGKLQIGMRGQHLFAIVADAKLIPELGQRIADRLWLAGHGRIGLTANGAMLERSLIDQSVWQPERLIFHRAHCRSGLYQNLPTIVIFPGSADELMGEGWLTDKLVPRLTDDEKVHLDRIKQHAKTALACEAEQRRTTWTNQRVDQLINSGDQTADAEKLRQSIAQALSGGQLPRELELKCVDGSMVRVDELLRDINKWHHRRFADPIEPDYRDDPRIAVAILKDVATPHLYSHAHGGILYPLSAPGRGEPAALEDFEDLTYSRQKLHGLQIMSAGEFAQGAGVNWLVKGVIPQASLAMVYGPSGSGKSFFVLDLAWAVIAGQQWKGLRTNKVRAIYVVAEGSTGFRNRLNAISQHHGPELSQVNLGIVKEGVDLRTSSHKDLIAKIAEWGGADLVIIDTLAQVVAGADENSGEDMGPVIKRCNEIIEATEATVLLVHHAGKDIGRGARGWSGIRAALDTEIQITKQDNTFTAKVTKQKDGDDGQVFPFSLTQVYLGDDEDGDAITSCVVNHLAVVPRALRTFSGRWQKLVAEVVGESEQFGPMAREQLLQQCCRRAAEQPGSPEEKSRHREVIGRALNRMVMSGVLVEIDETIGFHKPTIDTPCDDLRYSLDLTPTPHNSKECGWGVAAPEGHALSPPIDELRI